MGILRRYPAGVQQRNLQLHYAWDDNTRGQLRYVEDANGVITHYEYDKYGYFEQLDEGLDVVPGGRASNVLPATSGPFTNNDVGQTTGGEDDTGSGSWSNCINVLGLLFCLNCYYPRTDLPERLSNTVPAPEFGARKSCLHSAEYDVMGRPTLIEQGLGSSCDSVVRDHQMEYDDLGRLRELVSRGDGFDPNSIPPSTSFTFPDGGSGEGEGHTARGANASRGLVSRSRRTRACVDAPCTRTGRSRQHSPPRERRVGRRRPVVARPARTFAGSRTPGRRSRHGYAPSCAN